jgi:hypothetical protein
VPLSSQILEAPLTDNFFLPWLSSALPHFTLKYGSWLVSLLSKNIEPRRDNIPSPLLRKTTHNKMASNSQEDKKPNGAAFDDFFESLGKKADHLTIDERNGKGKAATNGTASENTGTTEQAEDENEPKIVDEIESLCMNCHENV